MALKFSTTQEDSNTVNILIYGRSGVGKTVVITTAQKPIIISSEKGLLSIASSNLPVIKVKTISDLEDAYEYIVKHKKKYKTVCLDSISDIAAAVLSDLKKSYKNQMQAYGELYDQMVTVIKDFRDLPMNTYFIAQAAEKDASAGFTTIRPSMPGKALTQQLPYLFDEVFCMRISEEEDGEGGYRYFQTTPDVVRDAKDRSGALLSIEEPDLKKIFKKIKKHIKEK